MPLFLLGHSAGGVIACLYALDRQHELAGLIGKSFAHEVPAPDFALAVFKGLSQIAPHAHILHLKNLPARNSVPSLFNRLNVATRQVAGVAC